MNFTATNIAAGIVASVVSNGVISNFSTTWFNGSINSEYGSGFLGIVQRNTQIFANNISTFGEYTCSLMCSAFIAFLTNQS